MEFWGVEVKTGEPLKVTPGDGMILHLSQACLGELKKEKGNESVCLSIQVDGKKLVLGTLFTDRLPQQQFDLIFDRDFELTHNWKNGSVYFYGYKASNPFEEDETPEGDSDESESEEETPMPLVRANNAEKGNGSKDQKRVKIAVPSKFVHRKADDDDMVSEDDDDSEDEDDSDDESGESDEETPKKVEPSKKRAAESATKAPVSDKKAKVTPQKTDGKKASGHVDTPHPAKQAGKTPKPQQTPKSGGTSACKSCNRTFGTEQALESHNKAKHGEGK